MVPARPKINLHRLLGAWGLYSTGYLTRLQLANEFDITGNTDEERQATQICDNLDARIAGLAETMNTGNVTWTNMPVAVTELFGLAHRRSILHLGACDQVRLVARVSTIGSASAVLFAQYSTNESAWSTLTGNVALGGGVAGTRKSAWGAIPTGAKTGDVFIRIVGQSGDAAADPIIGNVSLQVSVPWDKNEYVVRAEGVLMSVEDRTDRLFHDVDGVLVKAAVYTALGIAG
jgi:hypothetical protein